MLVLLQSNNIQGYSAFDAFCFSSFRIHNDYGSPVLFNANKSTVGSKIIRALEVIRSKNSYLMQICEINIHQVIIFMFYNVYNNHEMMKIGNQIREKLQVLSQVTE